MEKYVEGKLKCYECDENLEYEYCYSSDPGERFGDIKNPSRFIRVKFIEKNKYEVTIQCDKCNTICKATKLK